MAENNQVTVRFESTLENRENDNTDTLLLSGPIEIFATVDTFEELISDETANVVLAVGGNPIIYVADVRRGEDDYTNRGAYFRCESAEIINGKAVVDWREILLGTHSHSNIDALEKLYELSKQADVEGRVIALDKNGEFCLKTLEESNGLPELPLEIQEKLDALKRYDELHEPSEYEWHHLDAPLDQLDNTYDWLEKDEDGNYKNLAVGNCRELYRNLLASEEKLYISNDYTLSDEGKYWISLDVYKVNFNLNASYDDTVNAKVSPLNTKFYAASVELSDIVGATDEVFLLNNGEMLSDYHYSILEKNQKTLSILFNRNVEQFKDITTLTVLVVKNVDVKGFRTLLKMAFDNNEISLIEINNRLIKKYINNEFAKRPVLPKLYLSTDEYGNMVWDNKLLPTQTFYAKTVRIDISNIQEVEHNERTCAKIVFENANYRVGEDFPLLMVNDFFVFGVQPEISEGSKDLVYYLPVTPISGEGHYDFELIEPGEYRDVTLVLIKNSSAGSIADEIAEKYISKEDAVSILSHGKINLKDFVRKTELIKFSKLDHVHAQYALKDHNHDARYANFHHTHPEILLGVVNYLGSENPDEKVTMIQEWMDGLESKTQIQLNAVLDNIGIRSNEDNYFIEDVSVRLVENTEEMLREFSGKYNIPVPLTGVGLTVKDALEIIMRAFELDTVNDDQVLLEDDIPVNLVNGPIGGIDENVVYKAGTSLKNILQDMFNPYINTLKMRDLLTPDENTKIKWFRLDSRNVPYEIDLEKLQYGETGTLLFTVDFNNKYNKKCYETIVQNGSSVNLFAVPKEVTIGGLFAEVFEDNRKYYIYDRYFDFSNDDQDMQDIKISWRSSIAGDKIYDNYGHNEDLLNPNDDSLVIKPEMKIDYPDFFYGSVDYLENILYNINNAIDGVGEYTMDYGSGDGVAFTVNTENTPIIAIAVEEGTYDKGINIYDVDSHMNITKFFKELEFEGNSYLELFNGKHYVCVYYESLDRNSELHISLSLDKCKIC